MRVLANYWWLLLVPLVLFLWGWFWRRTPRAHWVWVLRILGVVLLAGTAAWLITGDIDTPYLRLSIGGGWVGVVTAIALGLLALFGARRLATTQGPPA